MTRFVTTEEAMQILKEKVKGTSAITVELDSPMDGKGKMLKTDNPFIGKGIVKRETLNGIIGYIYANSVNRVAAKEGKEERDAKPHPWGDMDDKHLFRIHRKTQKPYLSMKVENVHVFGFFTPDEIQIPDEEIRPFIPEKSKSSTQKDLEGEVVARDYDMSNIKVIRAFGEVLCLADNLTEAEKIDSTKKTTEVPSTVLTN
jgi:hypothetical protein